MSVPLLGPHRQDVCAHREVAEFGMTMTARTTDSLTERELQRENDELRARVEELERCRRRAEEALLESRTRLADALHTADMATWDWNLATNSVLASDTLDHVCGLIPGGEPFGPHLIHPEDRASHRAIVDAALARGEGWRAEYRIIRPIDGQIAWLEERASLTKHPESTEASVTGLVWDITARKRSDQALRESEVRYRSLFNSIDEGFIVADVIFDQQQNAIDLIIIEHNPAQSAMTGLRDIAGKSARELVPDLEEHWLAGIGQVVLTGNPLRFENRMAGLGRWFDVYVSQIGEAGSARVAIVFSDISERKRAEQDLRASETRQAFLVRLFDSLRLLTDPVEIQETASRLLGEHLGVQRVYYCEVSGDVIHVHRDYANGVASLAGSYPFAMWGRKLMREYLRGESHAVEDLRTDPLFEGEDTGAYEQVGIVSGMMIPLPKSREWGSILGVADGAPRAWTRSELRLAEEVAERTWAAVERARAEAALRESEARLQAVANVVPDLLWSNDATGYTDWFNDRWLSYTGLSYEDAVGQGWLSVIHPDDREAVRSDRSQVLAAGKSLRQEHRIRNAAGQYRWFLVQAEPLRDETGEVIRWFGAATDVHEQRAARERLEQRVVERTRELAVLSAQRQQLLERLVAATEEERQRLARELHDEMGQHLTALKVSLESLAAHDVAVTRMKEIVTRLDSSVDRLALELRPPALDDVGLCGAVSSLTEQFVQASGISVDVHLVGKDDQRLPDAIETAFYRVLQEALTNVWKHSDARSVSVILEKNHTQLQMIVEDHGRGFDVEQTLAGAVPHGHFGLLGMRERIALIGGTLDIESEAGHGTTVYVRVPMNPNSPGTP